MQDARNSLPPVRRLPLTAAAEVPLGALAGLVLGLAAAGIPGLVVGAVIGGAAGALLSLALLRKQHRDAESEDVYDEELGITRGSLGAPGLEHPPATIGAYSRASLGGGATTGEDDDDTPAAGPMSVGDA